MFKNVPEYDEEKLFAATKAFHALPLAVKMQRALAHHKPGNKNIYQGYFPLMDNDPSHKEFLDLCRPLEDFSPWELSGCAFIEAPPWITDEHIRDEC